MRQMRLAFYAHNEEHIAVMRDTLAPIEMIDLKVWQTEGEVIEQISSKGFDALIIDTEVDELEQNRLLKMTELVYPEAVYTTQSFEFKSFIILKINRLVDDWKDAQREQGGFKFMDNPI